MATEDDWLLRREPAYGAVRGSGVRADGGYRNVTVETASEPEGGKALFTRHLDRNAIKRARFLLISAAVVTILFAIAQFVGAIFAYSLCIFINSTSYLVIFSRLLFMAFLLETAGRPTSRLSSYRQHKAELHLVVIMLLIAWLVLGGALFLSVSDNIRNTYGIYSRLAFIITSGVGVFFAILVMGVMSYGKTLSGVGSSRKSAGVTANNVSPSIVAGLDEYSRERGLLLRRTLKHIPMRPYVLLTLWFALQCVAALVAAVVFWFWPTETRLADLALAYAFTPLALIASGLLIRDVVSILSEGILQGLDFSEVAELLISLDGVIGVRHLRIWALTMDRVSLSVMLALERGANVEDVLNKASALLKAKYDVFEYKIDTERDRLGPPPRRAGLRDTPSTTY